MLNMQSVNYVLVFLRNVYLREKTTFNYSFTHSLFLFSLSLSLSLFSSVSQLQFENHAYIHLLKLEIQ
jgi:hypothetical protein